MSKNRVRILLACAATGAILTSQATAKADSDTFLNDVYTLGFTDPAPTLLSAGYGVCISYQNGANGADVARYIYTHTNWTVTEQDAANFVIAATINLCPEWDHRPKGTIA